MWPEHELALQTMNQNTTRTIKLKLPLAEYGLPQEWGRPDQVQAWSILPAEFAEHFPDPTGHVLAWKTEEDERPLQLNSVLYCVWQESKTKFGLLTVVSNSDDPTCWCVHEIVFDPPPYEYSCQLYDGVPSNKEIDTFLSGIGMWYNWIPDDWRIVAGMVCDDVWRDLIGENSLPVLEPQDNSDQKSEP